MKTTTNHRSFAVYIVPAWKWKEFLAFELLAGTAFYLLCRKLAHSELFGIAANLAAPQMLKYIMAAYRSDKSSMP